MPVKKEYVVRVVQTMTPDGKELHEGGDIGRLVECLRYAQLVTIYETDPVSLITLCFDIHCPHGMDSQRWAIMNADRMKTFGFNAVDAPSMRPRSH